MKGKNGKFYTVKLWYGLGVWCKTSLSTIFQLNRGRSGGKFYWVEETGVPGENHWQTLSHNVVLSTPHNEQSSNWQL